MASWLFNSSTSPSGEYATLLDETTSELLPTLSLNGDLPADLLDKCLKMSDIVRSGQIKATEAVKAFKRRVVHINPNVQLLALLALDVAVKNSGDAFLREVANGSPASASTSNDPSLVDSIGNLARGSSNNEVRQTGLRLLQDWATAFETKPHLAISQLVLTYRRLRAEGCPFPPKDPTATAAMIDSMAAPEWTDSDVCSRCRDSFTITNRRHHCRNCGQIFDHKCSSKALPLPHFGITSDVRVCDGCYKKVKSGRRATLPTSPTPIYRANVPNRSSSVRHSSFQARSPYSRSQEDDDLQLALRLSLAESHLETPSGYRPAKEAPASQVEKVDDPELLAAIEASLREMQTPAPSAPIDIPTKTAEGGDFEADKTAAPVLLSAHDSDAILSFAQATMSRQVGPRELDPMFHRASASRPALVRAVADASRRQATLVDMNSKLMHAVKLYDGLLERQVARHLPPSENGQHPPYAAPPPSHLTLYASQSNHSRSQPRVNMSPERHTVASIYPALGLVGSLPAVASSPGTSDGHTLQHEYPSQGLAQLQNTGDWQMASNTAGQDFHSAQTKGGQQSSSSVAPESQDDTKYTPKIEASSASPEYGVYSLPQAPGITSLPGPEDYTIASFPQVPTSNPWAERPQTVSGAPEAALIEF